MWSSCCYYVFYPEIWSCLLNIPRYFIFSRVKTRKDKTDSKIRHKASNAHHHQQSRETVMCVCKTQLVEQYICLYAMKKIILSVFEFILNTSIRIEDKLNRKCLSTCLICLLNGIWDPHQGFWVTWWNEVSSLLFALNTVKNVFKKNVFRKPLSYKTRYTQRND